MTHFRQLLLSDSVNWRHVKQIKIEAASHLFFHSTCMKLLRIRFDFVSVTKSKQQNWKSFGKLRSIKLQRFIPGSTVDSKRHQHVNWEMWSACVRSRWKIIFKRTRKFRRGGGFDSHLFSHKLSPRKLPKAGFYFFSVIAQLHNLQSPSNAFNSEPKRREINF